MIFRIFIVNFENSIPMVNLKDSKFSFTELPERGLKHAIEGDFSREYYDRRNLSVLLVSMLIHPISYANSQKDLEWISNDLEETFMRLRPFFPAVLRDCFSIFRALLLFKALLL